MTKKLTQDEEFIYPDDILAGKAQEGQHPNSLSSWKLVIQDLIEHYGDEALMHLEEDGYGGFYWNISYTREEIIEAEKRDYSGILKSFSQKYNVKT